MAAGQETYFAKYDWCAMRREDGILEMRLHTGGDELVWDLKIHAEIGDLFADIGGDDANKVVILTGTGDAFLRRESYSQDRGGQYALPKRITAEWWATNLKNGQRLLNNLLAIEAPVIAAINGPATCHAELAVLSDIVLAADTASFADQIHFHESVLPGDGAHVVWPMLLGPNRGRYFLLTGQEIGAHEALELGVVNEVMPRDALLPRAWELARYLVERPNLVTRFARRVMTLEIRRALNSDVGFGLALEALASLDANDP